jgi:hypothetical protein
MPAQRILPIVPALALALGTATGCTQPAASDDRVATVASAAAAGNAGSHPDPTPSLSLEQQLQKWVECMRGEGIDMADPARNANGKMLAEPPAGTQKGGPLEEKFGDALRECEKLDPNDAKLKPFSAEELEQQRRWAQCMRGQGIEMNDPDPNGMPPLPKRGTSQAALQKATDACHDKMPRRRTGGQ